MGNERQTQIGNWLRRRSTWVLLAFLVIAAFFLVTEHTAHLFGILPYVLLLLCPLLHLFLHGRHNGHGGHAGHEGHTGHAESERPGSQEGQP